MKRIINIGKQNFIKGDKTTRTGFVTFFVGVLGSLLCEKYNIQIVLDNPELYWSGVGLVCSSLFFGGKK